jgi:hypothetical protein
LFGKIFFFFGELFSNNYATRLKYEEQGNSMISYN